MTTPALSIIIVNWKSKDFVRHCLTTLYEQSTAATYEVFVVDNATYDGVAEMLATEFPQVLFLQCEQNLGFAGANNLAFSHSRGRNILFLNPDTEIQGAAVQELLTTLESHTDAGMTGARLLNSDRTLQTTCVMSLPSLLNQTLDCHFLRVLFPRWAMWGMRALWSPGLRPSPVEAISGACMLARRDVMESIGVFSTDYFMYVEDVDLCLKVARAGWAIYYVPTATIVHHGGRSSARRESCFSNLILRASLVRFFQIHRGRFYAAVYRTSLVMASIARLFLILLAFPVAIAWEGLSLAMQRMDKWWKILLWASGLSPAKTQLQQAELSVARSSTLKAA